MSGKFHSPHASSKGKVVCVSQTEALAALRHAYLVSFFLEPQDIKSINLRAIWNFSKATGLQYIYMGKKGPVI
jgi:hypothetical protein